jgi:hypothetical protein
MKTFKDENGKPWVLSVNDGTVKKVRGLAGVDLLDLRDGNLFNELAADPVKLGDILWVLCQDEATAAGIDEMAFARALAGDALDSATNALLEEIVDFFPKPQRDVLRKALAKGREVQEREMARAMRRVDKALEEWKPEDESEASGASSTSVPASSA